MKVTCPFCHTEYAANVPAGRTLRCACCGRLWTPGRRGVSTALLLFAIITALLAAVLFAATLMIRDRAAAKPNDPLVVTIHPVHVVTDAFGVAHWVVTGTITNKTEKIYGVPSFVVVMKDDRGDVIATQKFLPPAPLLDASESVEFTHTIEESVPNAKRFGIEFVKE
ncbi:MAG: zinc-ribbon domain-containing protein [Proteobacteria bacterium]|nr:zinc-ribbon domain-containing protein [Pseudomonadota bacterium]